MASRKQRVTLPAPRYQGLVLPVGAVYDPPTEAVPAPPPQHVLGVGETYEALVKLEIPVPLDGANEEVTVFATSKRWRALDVALRVPFALDAGDMFTVRVYALSQGRRRLVSTGRFGVIAGTRDESIWICAARAQAERFEVTLSFNDLPTATQTAVEMTIAASDQANEAPAWVGVESLTVTGNITTETSRGRVVPQCEPLSICGTLNAGVATPRYLLVLEDSNPINGDVPFASFGMAVPGNSVDVDLRKYLHSRKLISLGVAVSTTPGVVTLAAAGDVAWNCFFR